MPLSAQQNTRVEKLCEAFENLAIGVSAMGLHKVHPNPDEKLSTSVCNFLDAARQQTREALREFMIPALRLVEGGAHQVDQEAPETDRVKCADCNRHFICADVACPHWHKAVRESVKQNLSQQDEEENGDPECA